MLENAGEEFSNLGKSLRYREELSLKFKLNQQYCIFVSYWCVHLKANNYVAVNKIS